MTTFLNLSEVPKHKRKKIAMKIYPELKKISEIMKEKEWLQDLKNNMDESEEDKMERLSGLSDDN